MILRLLLLMAAMLTRQLLAKTADHSFRRTDSNEDEEAKYHFVVALFNSVNRVPKYHCTGTLISPNWVLTAANCLVANTRIQFDELDLPINETNSVRQVLHMERPPMSTGLGPDIGLMFVNSVPMKDYGLLSAVDYKSIVGHAVTYVGFGPVTKNCSDCVGPMQIGGGVIVSSCNPDEKASIIVPVARLCIAPKCSERARNGGSSGEPGSPLFHANKLAGVLSGDAPPHSMRTYTPVSPYLTWMNRVLTKPELNARSGDNYNLKQYAFRKAEQRE